MTGFSRSQQVLLHGKPLEDILATDDLFVEYFNAFLSLPTFPEPLRFNKDTGWFEIVDSAKLEIARKIKAVVRASRSQAKIYRAAKHHSFAHLPLIPLEEAIGVSNVEEIDTSFSVTTLNKEQGLRWIKEKRFPYFLRSELYIEYRLAKIIAQAQEGDVADRPQNVATIELDFTPHPVKIRPEDISPEPEEDDSEQLMKNMYVCMGEALPTETEAWISQARIEEQRTLTSSTPSIIYPISSIASLKRPDSGLGSLTRLTEESTSEEEEIRSNLFSGGKASLKQKKSVTPRPSDTVCQLAEAEEGPTWKKRLSGGVYVEPSVDHTTTSYDLVEEEIASSESCSDDQVVTNITFSSVDELSAVLAGTTIKYLLAEFNQNEPEVYAHHIAVRILIPDESLRDFTLLQISAADCEARLDSPQPIIEEVSQPVVEKITAKTTANLNSANNKKESDEDSLLGSDGDYEEADDIFRKSNKKRYHKLTTKQGIDDFKEFLAGTVGETNWCFWVDIDMTYSLSSTEFDICRCLELIRERYNKKGSALQLTPGMKEAFGLTDSSSWTIEKLHSLQNTIAEPLLMYWAPRYLLKVHNELTSEKNQEYAIQKCLRVSSARREQDTYPKPRTVGLLPLRPKSCKPTLQTVKANIEQEYFGPTPKDFMYQPPAAVELPETDQPIGRRRTHAVTSVLLCFEHANGRKQRKDYMERVQSASSRPKSSSSYGSDNKIRLRQRPRSAAVTHSGEVVEDNSLLAKNRVISSNSDVQSEKSVRSEFKGGRRMAALLKALDHEQESGKFFRAHIERVDNKVWKGCVLFWEQLQDYHRLFYAEVLNRYMANKKARQLFSRFVAPTGQMCVQCGSAIVCKVEQELSPPYEELFDEVEEYALEQLSQAWHSMTVSDQEMLHQVHKKMIIRNVNTRSKVVVNLQRRGLFGAGKLEPDEDPLENFEDPVYDEALFDDVPEDFKEFTLDKIVRTPIHLENFRQYLQAQFATMDLSCWMDIEQFRRLDPAQTEEADAMARDIKGKYFNKKYFFGPTSPATKEGLDRMMKSIGGWGRIFPDRPDNELIIGAQQFARDKLEKRWLPLFLSSEKFAELVKPSQQMVDAAMAVMLNRQRRNQRLMKMLESRWVSSSKEIIAFRRALDNPVLSYQFQRYVAVRSDTLENDVQFWREVQKYKHLHHHHTEESFILQKVNVIINCFIDTQHTPPLQIDIPQEQADRIVEKKRELGPYVFRESQLTVFRVLFEHWTDFCTFRSNTSAEQILPTIERKRRRAKVRERQKQQEMEEQQEKEVARRRALGLPITGEDEQANMFTSRPEKFAAESGERENESVSGEQPRMSWCYSQYMDGLEREQLLNMTNEETFSCLSGDSSREKIPAKPTKPVIDISDLKDIKAQSTSPEVSAKIKKTRESTKGVQKALAKPPTGKDNSCSRKRSRNATLVYRAPEKNLPTLSRGMPPLLKK